METIWTMKGSPTAYTGDSLLTDGYKIVATFLLADTSTYSLTLGADNAEAL